MKRIIAAKILEAAVNIVQAKMHILDQIPIQARTTILVVDLVANQTLVKMIILTVTVLMVIFLLLSLTFFVHARSWYTFAAYESTMLAASEGRLSVEKGEAAAQSRMEWWISQIPLPAEPVTVQTVCREKEIQIKAEGNILPIWSRNAWEYSVLSESRRNNPVKTIRKIRAVKQIWNQK